MGLKWLYITDKDGYLEENPICLNCEHSYVDDLYNELKCRCKKCEKGQEEPEEPKVEGGEE